MPAARRPATTAQRAALFAEATAVVERDYAERLNLSDVARRIATSRRQLQRIYLEVGETTFRDQLTAVRMERAAELLSEHGRDLTVREIAHRVGYRQPAQFAKAFRSHHGQSPSEFRGGIATRQPA